MFPFPLALPCPEENKISLLVEIVAKLPIWVNREILAADPPQFGIKSSMTMPVR